MKKAKSRGRMPVMRQKIEAYVAEHPNAKALEVAKACGCTMNYAHTVRAAMKKKVAVKDTKSPISGPIELKKANELQVGGEHYRSMTVQPWDALEAWLTPEEFRGYQKGVAIAYLARERKKGGTQDIEKAMHHLMKLVESDASEGARG
jgi:hypothetical protein